MLTAELVRSLFSYDPDTGVFVWRVRAGKYPAGGEAGYINSLNRRMIRITLEGKQYHLYASRLAWFYVHGTLPKEEIDHINGNSTDDRFSNLREATRSQQLQNTKLNVRNTSGFRGVSWVEKRAKFSAEIAANGMRRRLGYFDAPEEAAAAYAAAAAELHGEYARTE